MKSKSIICIAQISSGYAQMRFTTVDAEEAFQINET